MTTLIHPRHSVTLLLGIWACAVLTASDAPAQTLPPANAFMGPPGTATMHANAASSDATTNPGP